MTGINGNPLVTVLMAVYNGEKYLGETIKSILSQTYANFELLIINDCSSDNTSAVIKSFKDSRIVVHTNPMNFGQTKSRNVGLRIANGEYVVINDHDDLSLPHRIQKQVDFILKHPEYVVVGASGLIIDKAGALKRNFRRPTDFREIYLGVLTDTPFIHGSVIISKRVILEAGGYDENYLTSQDYELWSRLIRKGFRIANLPDALVAIRHYSDSFSFRQLDRQFVEHSRILYENINALTTLKVSYDDATKQRLFLIEPWLLSKEEFKKAEDLFVNKYELLKTNNQLAISGSFISKYIGKQIQKPFCKLAIHSIENGDFKSAREISYNCLKRYGVNTMPFLIWVASHGGKLLAQMMFALYERWQEVLARSYYCFKCDSSEK